MSTQNNIKFFLGSNTKRGFVSLFNELRDPYNGNRLFLVKGGPGSGKSSLMKKVAKTLEEKGHQIEYIPCASDPNSLDAIIDHDAKIAMMDATAPHTLDPAYPGAYDKIINMADIWNDDILIENRKEIIEVSNTITFYHSMATTCITAAASLLTGNMKAAKGYIDHEALYKVYEKLIELLDIGPKGKEQKRLLSAVSVGKFVFFDKTILNLCPTQYIIHDDWGAASHKLLSMVREYALSKSLSFITCYCSIQNPDKIDHLLFPSLGIAFVTTNPFHSLSSDNAVYLDNLIQPIEYLNLTAMTQNVTMAQSLIQSASEHIAYAKDLHDDLEAYYVGAMDFSKVDPIFKQILDTIETVSKPS